MSEKTVVEGIDALRSLGAPPHVIELAEQLIAEGKSLELVVSGDEEPASVMLTLDGKPVANFRKSMSLEGEHNEALASDPRLAHAPITQVKERETHVFLGRKQLVQVLLARGVKIPKVCRDPTPEEIEAGAPADGKIPTDELGCEIYLDGKPFERTIEIVFPNPAD